MTESPQVLVVGIDFSEYGSTALSGALDLAYERPTKAVHVVHAALEREGGVVLDVPAESEEAERISGRLIPRSEAELFTQRWVDGWLRAHAGQHAGELPCPVIIHLVLGAAAPEIRRIAIEVGADTICVASHGRRGIRRALFGSVAEAIVREAPCSVMVVRKNVTPEIEPAYTLEEMALWEAAQERHLGERHTYHYYDRNVMAARTSAGNML